LPKAESSWFGFPVILKPGAPFTVAELTSHLNAAGIETRPIICGNIARQPALKLYQHRTDGEMTHADRVMDRAFSFGNHQAIDELARRYVTDRIEEFLKRRGLI
jgi:CDP-6-deoxy-D-xylo-4-hexulose-3-dehydrase